MPLLPCSYPCVQEGDYEFNGRKKFALMMTRLKWEERCELEICRVDLGGVTEREKRKD